MQGMSQSLADMLLAPQTLCLLICLAPGKDACLFLWVCCRHGLLTSNAVYRLSQAVFTIHAEGFRLSCKA